MKKQAVCYLFFASILFLSQINALAQAPNIVYSPSTNVFTKNTTISPLIPGNSGGAVPATVYGTVTTFVPSSGPINYPRGVVADGAGNIYEADYASNVIYKINSSGTATLIAGTGVNNESDNATGTAALLNNPWGIAYSASFIYVSDYSGSTIRKISTTAPYAVTTLAGLSGNRAEANGTGSAAAFSHPAGIVYDGSTYLYVCDNTGSTIRRVTVATGVVITIAGAPGVASELDNATGTSARFNGPMGIAYDGAGNLYVADNIGNTIRKVSTTAPYAVTTVVASTAGLSSPESIAYVGGNLYVADLNNNLIKRVTTAGVVTTIAGDGTLNDADGVGTAAEFYSPYAIAGDNSGNLFVGDSKSTSSSIRKILVTGYTISSPLSSGLGFNITTGIISGTPTATFSATTYTITAYNASGSKSTTVTLSCQPGLAAPNINYSPAVYVLTKNVAIATPITPTNSGGAVPATVYGTVTTPVTAASAIYNPRGLAIDGAGNIYEADYGGNKIYKISSSGTATLIAGTGVNNESDNTTGTSALFNNPWGVAYDPSGYIYVSDYSGSTIRKISTNAPYAVTTLAGLSGNRAEVNGTGNAAAFNHPEGIVYDGSNYLYVCDNGGSTIRRVTVATGAVITIAGASGLASELDNATGTSARFNGPSGIVYDGAGSLYVTDNLGNTIRKISTTAPYAVSTFVISTAGLSGPQGLTIDASGYLEVADAGHNLIRTITPSGLVLTLAGDGTANELDATGVHAEFYSPYAIVADYSGNLFVGDNVNTSSTIRKILLTGYTIVPVLNNNLVFNTSTGAITGTAINTFPATNYTVTAFNAAGSSSFVVTLSCGQVNSWVGTTNTLWTTPTNWSSGTVPLVADDVQIGVVTFTNQPAINSTTGNIKVNSITFGAVKAATLSITSPQTLTITGNITVNTGATATVTGTGSVNMAPNSALNVNGTGKLITSLSAGGLFTLQSDPTGDASVGQITATSITGTITVQRYLTGGSATYRGNRLLSSPVYNASDGNGNHIYSINYLKNAMYLTATTTNGGFDNTVAANPTLYIYRENLIPNNSTFTGGNFRGINNILASPNYTLDIDGGPFNILAGTGYLCFFRGNRASASFAAETTPGYVPQPVTLSTSGTLNAGPIVVRDWYTPASTTLSYSATSPAGVKGYQSIGNPYASAINWDTFQTSSPTTGIYGVNITNTMYVLDDVTKTFGSYVAGSGGVGSAAFVSNLVSSGQGFFVVASTTGGKLTINESAKSTRVNTGVKLLESTQSLTMANNQYIRLQVTGKDSTASEQTMIRFNNQAPMVYTAGLDAAHIPGLGEVSLSSSKASDPMHLSINNIPFPKEKGEAIKLNVDGTSNGTYTFSLRNVAAVPQLYDLWLMDSYKKDSVNMKLGKSYSFEINKTDSASFGSKRFALVVRQNQALAYQLLAFSASKVVTARQVEAVWATANEGNYTNFTVERSTDNGKTFSVLGGVKAAGAGNYSFLDKNPVIGTNLYRLKQEDINNNISYSKIVTIQYSNLSNQLAGGRINVYPNPVSSTINLTIGEETTDRTVYNIRVMNSAGAVVKEITSAQPTWQGSVGNLQPGTYLIRVTNNSTQSLVGENKFVKL